MSAIGHAVRFDFQKIGHIGHAERGSDFQEIGHIGHPKTACVTDDRFSQVDALTCARHAGARGHQLANRSPSVTGGAR